MPKRKLTYSFLNNLSTPEKRTEYYDTLVEGLFLRITVNGYKSFGLAYGAKGKRYTIGRFPDIGLADARDIAKTLKAKIALGEDPQAEKVEKRNQPDPKLLSDLSEKFKNKHLKKLKKSTSDDYKRRIDNVIVPSLGKIPLDKIERRDIIELLEEIAEENDAPIQSNRVRAILSSMFSFGVNRGLLDHNIVLTIKPLGKENRRKRVYTDDEIRDIWSAFEEEPEPYRSLFKMLLICGQRSGETRQMRWLDIKDGLWVIPSKMTKAKRTHHVPLPYLATDLLDKLSEEGNKTYVFASSASVMDDEPIAWLQKSAGRVKDNSGVKDFRLHDLRRTAASRMAELGVERTVLGKVLNHKGLAGDNQVTAVYDQFDYLREKKQALLRWNHHLEDILFNRKSQAKIYRIS